MSLFLALWAGPSLFAASSRSLVSDGNDAYSQEDYEQALAAYKQAVESDPESPYARYNQGAAHYRKGEFDDAVSAYQEAAMLARAAERPTLEARSRYNLGNAFYQQAVGSGGQNPQAALAALEKSVGSYKDALRQDRSFSQAAHNLELARRQIQLLREQMKNQPQGGGENSKDDLQEKLEENLEKQNELNKESQQQNQEQDQPESDELSKKQEQLQGENEELSKELESQQDQQSQQAKEHLDKAADQQQKAAEDLKNNQMEEAQASQEKASEELQKALNSMKGQPSDSPQQPQQAQDQQPQQGDQNEQAQQQEPGDQQQPAAQALQLSPQDIIDEEKASRKSRQLQVLGTLKPVDKDW